MLSLLSGKGPAMWFWLAGAIAAEVTATVSLRYSDGFGKPIPLVLTVLGYAIAFYALSRALSRGMALGIAYGVWAATGVALIAVIGTLFLGERLTWIQAGGIILVIGGVLALELGGSASAA